MALEKAILTNTLTNEEIPVLFNPEQYALTRQNNFASIDVHGLQSPLLQFVNGALRTLELELLVDTLEKHVQGNKVVNRAGTDVRLLTEKIVGLLTIDRTTHAPPIVLFTWGKLDFTAVITQANQTFVLFRNDGVPLRARLQLSFSEFTNAELEAKERKRETADYSKTLLFNSGDTLPLIASREYGSPQYWRLIAAANAIEDPRRPALGQELLLPKLPYTDPTTGRTYR